MKITYLFGAGASCNCLPIVSEITDRMERMLKLIEVDSEAFFQERWNLATPKKEVYNSLVAGFNWLISECRVHASVDTFAKKLFIRNDFESLRKLKLLLSIYFVFEQSHTPYDKRYDTFFASLLGPNTENFPENVRVLSWNYDYQFEIAYSEYTEDQSLGTNQRRLNVFSKHSYSKFQGDKFSIIKLNGTCNFLNTDWREQHLFTDKIFNSVSSKLINEQLEYFATIFYQPKQYLCGLSFAWEKTSFNDVNIVDIANSATRDTEILVVIGYSFPYFNRDVDREIIREMPLRQVYFQSPEASGLKERFRSIRDDLDSKQLLCLNDCFQFFLPNEL